MSSANIFLDEGATGSNVEVQDGDPGHESAVLTFTPDRGTAVRLLNAVAAGSSSGLPLYMKPRDGNGDPLPVGTTTVYLAVKRAGQSSFHRISEEITNIGHYVRNDITTQQDADNIDQSKVDLQYPEASGKEGTPSSVLIRGIDEFAIIVDSAVAWSANQSVAQLDTDAVEGPFSN
ncbi:hypothetical protein [Halobacterium noricense]|uniref:hypothetical protein n=1 Tax=Halobacterium noricense TaxID=223182 RepID=UPI001E5FEC4A|nr:hypothetical protein [Halobacterium noricense]UHH26453.1 hypothetical protein LT974_05825 [Halobacterium noricense]